MPDGGIAPHGVRSMVGKSLLFPLSPEPGETLLGFLVRSAEHNYLPSPSPILSDLGVNLHLKGDCLGRLAEDVPLLAEVLGLSLADVHRLWGAEPLSGGRRRLGGVWLRPSMIFSSHRRLPRMFVPSGADQALWMVRNLGFCPESWELLVDRCPRPWCGRRLTWCSANSLHLCGFCGASVSEADRQVVPRKDRRALAWLADLFVEDEERVSRSLREIPPAFVLEGATEAYELVSALVKPMRGLSRSKQAGKASNLADLASACRFVLDFPRSVWDLQQLDKETWHKFRSQMQLVAQYTPQTAVAREVRRILEYGHARIRSPHRPSTESIWLTISAAARLLKVERSGVRALIDAGLLPAMKDGGGEIREHSAIPRNSVVDLDIRIRERIGWKNFCSESGLPQIAAEQLLATGLLHLKEDLAVSHLFRDRQLERDSAYSLLNMRWPSFLDEQEESNWVPLSRVMQGVGGREKPWARIIQAALNGDLPGGVRRTHLDTKLVEHCIHPITARRLIMGGPFARTPFDFQDGDLGEHWRPHLSPGETALHLNCTAQDITWLRSCKMLEPVNAKGRPTHYVRSDVEALGRELISTREIAARLGLKPVDVWQSLQNRASGGAFGQGFYERGLVEPILCSRH